MQNSPALNSHWYLEYIEEKNGIYNDKIMGWTSSNDPNSQLSIQFPTLESAIAYANKAQIDYEVIYSNTKKFLKKTYAENFQ